MIHKTIHAVQISPGGEAGAVVRNEQTAKHLARLFGLFASVDHHLKKKSGTKQGHNLKNTMLSFLGSNRQQARVLLGHLQWIALS
jgi:hypothetical protein